MLNQYVYPIKASIVGALLLAFVTVVHAEALKLGEALIEFIAEKYGESAKDRLLKWQLLANTQHDKEEDYKLFLVNAFFNQTTFVSDWEHWGKEDYWATPVELLATNGGDCEDYSIAKYFTLRMLGVDDEKMRITYVKAIKLNQAHMVLAYYPQPDSDPLILDNLISEIVPASERQDLVPVYSFNGNGLWLSKQRGTGKRLGDSKKLSRWSELVSRYGAQLQ